MKSKEIEKIADQYPDLKPHERIFKCIETLSKKAIEKGDHTELAAIDEYGIVFDGLYINPNTGKPTGEAHTWIRRLLSMIRRDKAHPHIRPYTQAYAEIDVNGNDVVRNYIDFLRGKSAIIKVNNRLEKQRQGLREIQQMNNELANARRVGKEIETYSNQLELKQQEANRRKRRK